MKRIITSKVIAAEQYDNIQSMYYGRNKYMVRWSGGDQFGDTDKMFSTFRAQVSSIHPYDLAEYPWARIQKGRIDIILNQKIIYTDYYFNSEDEDIEDVEWSDSIIERAIGLILKYSKNIESRIDRT